MSTKSLMDAIGREKAQTLMDEAVFQAIEENRAHGLGSSKLMLGYARVSTDDQDLTNQRTELHSAGCIKIFGEKITGVRRDRPELARLLDHLRPGDVVTVTRLDRLARSTRDLLDIAERIQATGAGQRSLAEPWADTTTPAGRPHGADRVRRHCRVRAIPNHRPHQERPRSGQGARREVWPPPYSLSGADRARPRADRPGRTPRKGGG